MTPTRLAPGLLVASLFLPVSACTAEDILALTALFFATGGPGWRAVDPTVDIHAHWMQGDACCTWPGISCNKMGEVRKIKLGQSILNVRGTLPSDLYLLHSLKELSLKRLELSGTLPSTLCDAFFYPRLRALDVGNTALSGTLPSACLGPRMKEVDIGRTFISGTLPASMERSRRLRKLSVERTRLSGTIPSLVNATALDKLDASDVGFVGAIPALPDSLRQLLLHKNRLSGSLPADLPPSLQLLRLHENLLSGTIPASLPQTMRRCQLIAVDTPPPSVPGRRQLQTLPAVSLPTTPPWPPAPPPLPPLDVWSTRPSMGNFFLCPLPAALPPACQPAATQPGAGTHCQGMVLPAASPSLLAPPPPSLQGPSPIRASPPPPSPFPPPPSPALSTTPPMPTQPSPLASPPQPGDEHSLGEAFPSSMHRHEAAVATFIAGLALCYAFRRRYNRALARRGQSTSVGKSTCSLAASVPPRHDLEMCSDGAPATPQAALCRVRSSSIGELRNIIENFGLIHEDCTNEKELQVRALQALRVSSPHRLLANRAPTK